MNPVSPVTRFPLAAGRVATALLALSLLLIAGAAFAAPVSPSVSSANGTWSQIRVPQPVASPAVAIDAAGGRVIQFGGGDQYALNNETIVYSFSPAPALSRLDAVDSGDPIPARSSSSLIFDSARNRVLLFGGNDGGAAVNDLWSLSLAPGSLWTRMSPAGAPPSARSAHTAIYDPTGDRMIVFGGSTAAGASNETWQLALAGGGTWSQLTPSGGPATARYFHTAVFDPAGQRMFVYGGSLASGLPTTSTWQLSLSGAPAWTLLTPSGVAPKVMQHAAAYDAANSRMIVFGGLTQDYVSSANTYSLSLAGSPSWSQLSPTGGSPVARNLCTAVYDPAGGRTLMFGGVTDAPVVLAGIWALTSSGSPTWQALAADAGPARSGQIDLATYDPVRDAFAVAGAGYLSPIGGTPPYNGSLPSSGLPGWLDGHQSINFTASTIYDWRRDETVCFGGLDQYLGTSYNDAIGRPLAGGLGWAVSTTNPSKRWGHAAVYDPRRDRLLIFGGASTGTGLHNDVWGLSLTTPRTWSQVIPTGTPPSARDGSVLVYDPVRDRALVFAGEDGTARNDLWSLDLSGAPSWTKLFPAGSPPPPGATYRSFYDPVRDRVVISNSTTRWALDLSGTPTWSTLVPDGTAPAVSLAVVAYDPVRDRMMLEGMNVNTSLYRYAETWALTFGDPQRPLAACTSGNVAWTPGQPALVSFDLTNGLGGPRAISYRLESARAWPGMPMFGTTVVGGGATQSLPLSVPVPDSVAAGSDALMLTTWYEGGLGYNTISGNVIGDAGLLGVPGPSAITSLAIEAPRPNPARELRVSFTLPDSRTATLEAYDISGRCVAHQTLAGLAPGRHTVSLGGARSAPGVYMIRLRQGAQSAIARTVLIR